MHFGGIWLKFCGVSCAQIPSTKFQPDSTKMNRVIPPIQVKHVWVTERWQVMCNNVGFDACTDIIIVTLSFHIQPVVITQLQSWYHFITLSVFFTCLSFRFGSTPCVLHTTPLTDGSAELVLVATFYFSFQQWNGTVLTVSSFCSFFPYLFCL